LVEDEAGPARPGPDADAQAGFEVGGVGREGCLDGDDGHGGF